MADEKRGGAPAPGPVGPTIAQANPSEKTIMRPGEQGPPLVGSDELGRQAAANLAKRPGTSEAKRKMQAIIDAGKPNLTQQTIESYLVSHHAGAGKDPREAKALAAKRAAEMTGADDDDVEDDNDDRSR